MTGTSKNSFGGINQEGNEYGKPDTLLMLLFLQYFLRFTVNCHRVRQFQVGALSNWQLTFAYTPFAGQ